MAVAVLALSHQPSTDLSTTGRIGVSRLRELSHCGVGRISDHDHELGVPLQGGSGVSSGPHTEAQIQRNYHGAFGTSTINFDTWRSPVRPT